jgi:rubrerythrin
MTKKLTKLEFIQKAKEVHGDMYDYSKVEYKNNKTKVCIICSEHGEFWQTPTAHVSQKQGCPKCGIIINSNLRKDSTKSFIQKAEKVHDNKYDYSKVEYVNTNTNICIICPEHGEFWQMPTNHLQGHKCPKCSNVHRLNTQEFIDLAKEVHGDKYNYSKVEYKNNKTKVCITCPIHGEFWQTPTAHVYQEQGCPKCIKYKLECELIKLFDDNNIKYEFQKRFSWLKRQVLDFYLPDYNIAIECQGIQHFNPVDYFGGEKGFKETIKRDKIKKELCIKNKVNLIYYSNIQDLNIINSTDLLIKVIKNET